MPRPFIDAAVEGPTDEAVVERIIDHAGGRVGTVYGKRGKGHLGRKIAGYDNAARHAPWLVLVDLDADADCAPPLCETWLPDPAPFLCFRVAVRAVEAWLMADPETLAPYLGVQRNRISGAPENLENPKAAMVALAHRSRRRAIRQDMVPGARSGRRVGPAYPGRLIEYAATEWRPGVAAGNAESLRRAIDCLPRVVADYGEPGRTGAGMSP